MFPALLLIATLVTTQMPPLAKGQFPEGWTVRVDGAGAGAGEHATHGGPAPSSKDIAFVTMAPGWHVTTGPAAIFYRPNQTATGAYALKAEIFQFDPGARREGYGLLLGGRALDGADQAYTYFLIRRSGEFLIKRRTGAKTVNVKEWTPAAAIRKYDDKPATEQAVKNVLEVKVTPDTTAFLVNGTEVARVPTSTIDTSGIVGLRINHQLNLHVTSIDVTR